MGDITGTCFVIMPFVPELHYFYLYFKQHIEQRHNILCERADAQILTKPILDKINDAILSADVVIADCSGRNPNIFNVESCLPQLRAIIEKQGVVLAYLFGSQAEGGTHAMSDIDFEEDFNHV